MHINDILKVAVERKASDLVALDLAMRTLCLEWLARRVEEGATVGAGNGKQASVIEQSIGSVRHRPMRLSRSAGFANHLGRVAPPDKT